MTTETSTKFDFAFAESYVRFSLRGCFHKKDYSISHVDRESLRVLLKRLMHIEDNFTWKEFVNLPREKGVTKEKVGTDSFECIREKRDECEGPSLGDDDYFYHFRVKDKELFRVFGYQKRDMFCVTHFDVQGSFHH